MTKILGGRDGYNGQTHTWRTKDDRIIDFGSLPDEDSFWGFQGIDHDALLFDEITQFSLSQFKSLLPWVRTDIPGQRVRVLATGNPPMDSDGEWVIKYWAPWLDPDHKNPAKPGELRYFVSTDDGDVEVDGPGEVEVCGRIMRPHSRTFIPGRVTDNPFLMETDYLRTLENLPAPLRDRMLHGLFFVDRNDNPWQVIPSIWVEAAMRRWETSERPDMEITAVGVDVARGGEDYTVLAPRYGDYIDELRCYSGLETNDGPKAAALVIGVSDGEGVANIDVIGIGSSCYDSVVASGMRSCAINGSAKSLATDRHGKMRFINKRAEMYWKLREALDPEAGATLKLPRDTKLLADLTTPRWKLTSRGIQVESKMDIKKRIGRSPDRADAVAYSLVDDDMSMPDDIDFTFGFSPGIFSGF